MKRSERNPRGMFGSVMGSHSRRWLRPSYVILMILFLLILLPLSLHYLISNGRQSHSQFVNVENSADAANIMATLSGISCDNLKQRIRELLNIKASVTNELRDFEQKRKNLQDSIFVGNNRIESLHQEESRLNTELSRLKMSVEQAKIVQKELYEKNMPEINAPRSIKSDLENFVVLPGPSIDQVASCRMFNCFDYSRCSILSGFPVYFYEPEEYKAVSNELGTYIKTTVRQAFKYNSHTTQNPLEACLFVTLVGESHGKLPDREKVQSALQNLPYWSGDGRNHVLLNLVRNLNAEDVFSGVNIGKALIVQSQYSLFQMRPGYDVLCPPLLGPPGGDLWRELPPFVPALRKYLLSFQGELPMLQKYMNALHETDPNLTEELNVIQELTKLSRTTTSDKFLLQFSCRGGGGSGEASEWQMCGSEQQRKLVLESSTFSLVVAPPFQNHSSTPSIQARLFESLKAGSIPVVLGGHVRLPFAETIDWNKAAIVLPKPRVTELHYFLRTFPSTDILAMRRQGRLVWEKYLGSTQAIVDTILATIRERLNIPPIAAFEQPSSSVFNASFVPETTDAIIPEPDTDENMGPIEPPFPSITFKRNFSAGLFHRYEAWNVRADPFFLYPHLPSDPILPSEAKFVGSQVGFRPINKGGGGSGKEFSEALGGNSPREQFTVVMLTYEREQVLMNSLARLYGLPYLNKVIVVWNSPRLPKEDLKWPDLKVPIKVIRAEKNSLNNRFLPYAEIETEAILSVDDDAHLRHDEIVFGFRVWREERDRIVGFPGRFHAWDLNHGGWLYNSNYSCELSMVLTGAAFFHKYYAYAYSQAMPLAVRDKVDEYMNCEDIALNFLVSHLTRKPPVKVTSRWTFRCPGCPVSLSEDDSHFLERHKCISFFTQVFGYNPLLYTQYRVDSVLFKTRLPQDKQKCFKFI